MHEIYLTDHQKGMETLNCLICELPFDFIHEEITHVKKRGCRKLKKASRRRGDGKFTFLDLKDDTIVVTVHTKCQRIYTYERSVRAAEKTMRKSLHWSEKKEVSIKIEGENGGEPVLYEAFLHVKHTNPEFDYANLCLFCGEDASDNFLFQQLKKPAHERNKVILISKRLLSKIMLLATVWGEEVLNRVKDRNLVSLNARFHNPCYTEYLSAIPKKESITNAGNEISLKKNQHTLLDEDSEKMETSKEDPKEEFDYETHCIICAKDASEAFIAKMKKVNEKKRIKVTYIQRPETTKNLLQLTYKSNETYREEVRSRIEDQDLVALKARYHNRCYKQLHYVKTGAPIGRPRDLNKEFNIEIEETQPTSWDEYYQDYIVNEDVEFNFQIQCIICGRGVSESGPKEAGNSIRVIQRHDTGENLLNASLRFTDKWREQVRDRVKDKDLVALGARYHKSCFPQFFIPPPKKQIVCVADSNVSDYLLCDQEEQNAFSDVFDDISLDNEHDSYYDLPLIENEPIYQKEENIEIDSQNNSCVCKEDPSEQFIKKQTEIQPENKISTRKKIRKEDQSTEISIKKSALQNKQKLRACHIIPNDDIKTVNSELSASNDLTDFNKSGHEIVEQQSTTDGEKGSLESVSDCDDTNEDHEETQDGRNLTEDEAISLDYFQKNEEYYEKKVCNTCLTPGRKLYRLVRYAQIFNAITGNNDTVKIYVCGECLDDLKKIQHFKEKAVKAKKILDEIRQFKEIKNKVDDTTLMKETCTSNEINDHNENSNEDYSSDWVNDNQVNDDETDLQNNSQPTSSGLKQKCAVKSNDTATKRNNANKQYRAEEASDFDLSAEDASDSDLEPATKKHKTCEKDSDYVPSDVEKETKSPKKKKNKENKRTQCKITNTGIKLKGVVKKVKIDPEDAKTWIEKERNSDFFLNLQNKCVLCVSKLQRRESLNQHLATFHNSTLSTHVCSVCKIAFKTTENLNRHLEQHNFLLHCGVCGYQCYGKHNMNDHLSGHRRSIECLECGALFKYVTEFNAHYQKHFKCNECGKYKRSKEKLRKHIERLHAINQCNKCNKIFRNYVKLQKHQKLKHVIERKEDCYCVSCDKQFSNSELLKRHLFSTTAHAHERTETRTVTCSQCNRVLSSKYSLKEHYKSFHSKEKRTTFPCSVCGKQFSSRSHLKTHIKYIHDRVEKPRNKVCQYCDRAFKTKENLIHHIRTHTGERPNKCPFCDAAFAQKYAMQTHIQKRHKNEQSSILTPPTGTNLDQSNADI